MSHATPDAYLVVFPLALPISLIPAGHKHRLAHALVYSAGTYSSPSAYPSRWSVWMEELVNSTPHLHLSLVRTVDSLKGLSEDILVAVCSQLESLFIGGGGDTVWRKHEKNESILAFSSVCKSWYWRLTSCKTLFQDIAFHVSSPESIATAKTFLKILEGTNTPTYVYAFLGHSRDPELIDLFANLRLRIEHIVHFEYHGDMAEYRLYLDSPAPNLLFFSDHFDTYPGRGPPLFRGHVPKLRSLTTSSLGPKPVWTTSTLSNLTTLELAFLDMGLRLYLGPFLNLLRGSPRLESIFVGSFVPLIDPNDKLQDVLLPRLRVLHLRNNEFHTIIKRLKIPNAHTIVYYGESRSVCGGEMNPTFLARHLFDDLPLFPIFDQPIERVVIGVTRDMEFWISLTAKGVFVLKIHLAWVDMHHLFNDYAIRTVSKLVEMIALVPQPDVQLSLQGPTPFTTLIYQPFLLLGHIDRLTTRGRISVDILNRLIVHADTVPLLPRLRRLKIMGRSPLMDGDGELLLSCLKSRGNSYFSICLVDDALPCAVYEASGYIVKEDADDPHFVVVTFDPNLAVSGI